MPPSRTNMIAEHRGEGKRGCHSGFDIDCALGHI